MKAKPKEKSRSADAIAARKAWIEKSYVTWCDMGYGGRQYSCFHPEYVAPVGVVWTMPIGGKADMIHVLHSYVLPYFRRKGVRTRIHETMKGHCRLIHTWEGTQQGGEAWLKANGYTFDRVRKDWHVLTGKK